MKIKLKNNYPYKWKNYGGLLIKGDIGCPTTQLLKNSVDDFQKNITYLEEILIESKQFFSLVLETEDYIFAAVDHLRMHPLFYSLDGENAYLSDEAEWISQQLQNNSINNIASAEFLMTGYITGSYTIYEGVRQLEAGEYLIYNRLNKKLEVRRYYPEVGITQSDFNKEGALNELDEIHLHIFKRLIKSLNGRTAVLPLSGGYDSRVIAMMLKRLGYEKVICFTYGKPGNWEAKVSKEIADFLGFKWYFVSYTPEKWKRWYTSNNKNEYFEQVRNLSSLAHIQDHIAIEELIEKEIIPKNSVIIPGHTAILSFSGFDARINDIEEATTQIIKKHYSLWSWTYKNSIQYKKNLEKKVSTSLNEYYREGNTIDNSIYHWERKERHAKFICNSVRAYEHFGLEWFLPLWEKELVEYWIRVPQKYRINKYLYKEYFEKEFNYSINAISQPNSHNNIKKFKSLKKKFRDNTLITSIHAYILRTTLYYKHPLDWYRIIKYSKYLNGIMRGAGNINSYLIDVELEEIKNVELKNMKNHSKRTP